jgi:hypothetical protein
MTADLRVGIDGPEQRLAAIRPDLPPRTADYDQATRRQLDGADHG